MKKRKNGISLIVLIVTIVVIIILLIAVLYNITDGKIFGIANESVFKNDLRVIEEEFEMFVQTKATESIGKFEIESLNAGDNGITYNTKTNEKEENIYDVIPTAKRGYYSEFEIIKGELYYKGDVEQKLMWAKEIGIGIIPYEIVDGVLISANSNLLLLDSTGTVRIPYNVIEIAQGVFNNLDGLTRVIIPGSVKKIGRNAFSNNKSLQEVIIEDGVEEVGIHAFSYCDNLRTIKLPETIYSIEEGAFVMCKNLESIDLPNSLTKIGAQAFLGSGLKEIVLPESLQTISTQVFSSCKNLEKVVFLGTTTTVSGSLFSYCSNLNYIDVSKNNNYIFENNCFYTKDYATLIQVVGKPRIINVNNKTENIMAGAMDGVTSLTEVYIPASVKSIGPSALGKNRINKLVVDENNQYYASYDNDLYDKNLETLIKCNKNGDVIVKEGVKQVQSGTFLSSGVTSIKLPESLESISGHSIFPVKEIYIPSNVNSILATALLGIEKITVSEANTKYKAINNKYLVSKDEKILYYASTNVTNLNDLPKTIEVIEYASLYSHSNLEEVVLNSPIKEIKEAAFDSCSNLKRIEIAGTIEKIAGSAFTRSNNLSQIIIHKKRGEVAGEPWGAVYGIRIITYDN